MLPTSNLLEYFYLINLIRLIERVIKKEIIQSSCRNYIIYPGIQDEYSLDMKKQFPNSTFFDLYQKKNLVRIFIHYYALLMKYQKTVFAKVIKKIKKKNITMNILYLRGSCVFLTFKIKIYAKDGLFH